MLWMHKIWNDIMMAEIWYGMMTDGCMIQLYGSEDIQDENVLFSNFISLQSDQTISGVCVPICHCYECSRFLNPLLTEQLLRRSIQQYNEIFTSENNYNS